MTATVTDTHRVQGLAIADLAATYGTPMYLYDGDSLRAQFTGLREHLHPALEMFFSLKANPSLSVCALLRSLGARAEISSMTELITAARAGVSSYDTIFLGPGKSRTELAACIDAGLYAIVCESLEELALIDEIARERGTSVPVMLRVNPSFAVKGSGLTMGGKPRQFGIDEQVLFDQVDLAKSVPSVRLIGVHVYMGTRILDESVIAENTRRILDLAERVAAHVGFALDVVDIGGGLGVAYFDGERDLDPRLVASHLNPLIEEFTVRYPTTRLIMELGRYLTAPSGTYVVAIRYTKTSMGENFAVADGGTNHHMAAVGIGSYVKRNFPMALLARDGEGPAEPWNVTGPLCTPNDTIGKGVPLPALRSGDLVGVLRSGAYGPTASPVHFLSHGYPAEVLVDRGRAHLIRRRDTPDDLLRPQSNYQDDLAT